MNSSIQFRLAARTDAAGKYNPNAPLEGNEDNMFVDSDLTKDNLGEFTADEVVNLSDKGCLMVVADGMGGMNAGEVASAIAIKTVMEYFAPEKLTDNVCKDSKSRMRYLENVVVEADSAIKKDSRSNPDHEGMGSTIIMAWLCDDEICLTWCGDSRAYLFRPSVGFGQVSKDHSYVQSLVDEGKITEVQAFDHPYGNIITRSLGDPDKKAKPDSKCFKVYQGDIFMLCSDGLSGVLRDRKTYNENGDRLDTENLEDIIAEHRSSMAECRDCLFEAAQRNEWYDNVTAILCEIVKNDTATEKPETDVIAVPEIVEPVVEAVASDLKTTASPGAPVNVGTTDSSHRNKLLLYVIIAVIAFGSGGFLSFKFIKQDSPQSVIVEESTMRNDTEPKNVPFGQSEDKPKPAIEQSKPTITPKPEEKNEVVDKNDPKQVVDFEEDSVDEKPVVGGTNVVEEPDVKEEDESSDEVQNDKEPRLTEVEANSTNATGNNIIQPTNSNNLNPATGKSDSQGRKPKPKDPELVLSEDEMIEKINSIDDCCKYVKDYGKANESNYKKVVNKFKKFYHNKYIELTQTLEGGERFVREHDKVLRDMGLTGDSDYEKYKGLAEEKVTKLKNNNGTDSQSPRNRRK